MRERARADVREEDARQPNHNLPSSGASPAFDIPENVCHLRHSVNQPIFLLLFPIILILYFNLFLLQA